MILPQDFYNQKTLKVAQDLLGCFLVRSLPLLLAKGEIERGSGERELKRYKIVETEAYNGPNDLASHASRGMTERNKVMFDPPGTIYVYFTYGMHYMLNIVTEKEGYPAAVLIRAVEITHPNPSRGGEYLNMNGPAKLTKALQINKNFNGAPIYIKKYGLWIESRQEGIKPSKIKKAPRIGVDYAGDYKDKLWRFYIKDNRFVSRK